MSSDRVRRAPFVGGHVRNAVELRIYHHPIHDYVVDRTMRSMKASLDYFTTEFGPYPYGELRLVEIPRYGGFSVAHPYMISFTEDYFVSRVREGERPARHRNLTAGPHVITVIT